MSNQWFTDSKSTHLLKAVNISLIPHKKDICIQYCMPVIDLTQFQWLNQSSEILHPIYNCTHHWKTKMSLHLNRKPKQLLYWCVSPIVSTNSLPVAFCSPPPKSKLSTRTTNIQLHGSTYLSLEDSHGRRVSSLQSKPDGPPLALHWGKWGKVFFSSWLFFLPQGFSFPGVRMCVFPTWRLFTAFSLPTAALRWSPPPCDHAGDGLPASAPSCSQGHHGARAPLPSPPQLGEKYLSLPQTNTPASERRTKGKGRLKDWGWKRDWGQMGTLILLFILTVGSRHLPR